MGIEGTFVGTAFGFLILDLPIVTVSSMRPKAVARVFNPRYRKRYGGRGTPDCGLTQTRNGVATPAIVGACSG